MHWSGTCCKIKKQPVCVSCGDCHHHHEFCHAPFANSDAEAARCEVASLAHDIFGFIRDLRQHGFGLYGDFRGENGHGKPAERDIADFVAIAAYPVYQERVFSRAQTI